MKILAAFLSASALLLTPSLAIAHPSTSVDIYAGFLHPFTGVDHLLALTLIGVFAAQLTTQRAVLLASGFLAAFTVAFAAAGHSISFPAQETVLALSLLGMAALVLLGRRLPFSISLAITALFAVYHGAAHGNELGGFAPIAALGGFFLASLLLTGGAYVAGRQFSRRAERVLICYRAACAALASFTGLLLLAAT